ncbi:MAG: AAA family ATPase, partial [Gemmatimonadota bacterium]|nr:AAA family ATPase [Gemmatimonadota bacterium]
MDTPFYLKCLGQPALIAPNGDVVRFRTRKHLALLVYLGAEPRAGHRRDRLADLLWSSATEAEARHSLATALSIIRSKLGPEALDCSRDQVRLAGAAVVTDLGRLASGDIFGDEGGEMLDVAGFLEGFEVADAVEFMLWKDRQQARWLPAIRDALVRLMDRCRRTGDFTRIEQVADRMLVLDELSEEAIRAKMEARAFAGDRLTALRIFESWKEDLARELGATPSPLVDGMAIRLRRRGWERTATNQIPNVPTDHWKDRVFIGRGREYRGLYEGWERMQRGEVGHALVAGDSGVGKSTLVERFTTAASLEGAALTRVQCYEPDRGIPYGAVGLLIPPLLDRPGASATPPEALAELARTVPEVRRRYPAIPQAADSQGETARLRLAEAFHELLKAVAEEHPVIVVVDDLHHCDDVSLAVLHLVIRKARGQPILIVFTVRPGEAVQSPQAQHLLERAASLGLQRIDVPPLTEAESEQAITAMVGAERVQPSSAVRRALVRAAAGYPMVLELLVQDWEASGDQCLAVSVGAMTAEPAASGGDLPTVAYRA